MSINHNVTHLLQKIHTATQRYHRERNSVQLLAVSKKQSTAAIIEAHTAGLSAFGESYLQEALPKIEALVDLPLQWHFIGPIQSNKTKAIARHFSWVHSVSQCKMAQHLNDARGSMNRADTALLNVCIQVNLDSEETKSGVTPDSLIELARFIVQLPQLQLRGLMCIPKPEHNPLQQYQTFLRLTTLLASLNSELHLSLDTLSMGMSDSLDAAIHAGSTIVRVGRGIFGERE